MSDPQQVAVSILYWPVDDDRIMLAAFDSAGEQTPALQGQCPMPESELPGFLERNKGLIKSGARIENLHTKKVILYPTETGGADD